MAPRLLRTLGLLALVAGAAMVFLLQHREERRYSADGRIVIDRDFLQNHSRPPRLFDLIEAVLELALPESFSSLEAADLKQAALSRCSPRGKLGRFWDHPYGEEAFTALTDAIKKDKPALTNLGRLLIRDNIINWLCTQIKVAEFYEQNKAQVDNEHIDALVIAGSPRTGSTHLLSMLCEHPDATCLTFTEALSPFATVSSKYVLSWLDFRVWHSLAGAQVIAIIRPLFKHMFKFGALAPMEEIQLGANVFGSSIFLTQMYLPTYDEWFKKTDHTPMEEYIKFLLKVIQIQRGTPRKLWILKSPQNADQLGPKMRTYPDAKVVFTHRHVAPVIQSTVGMVAYTVGIFNRVSEIDYEGIARLWLEHQRWSVVEKLSREEVEKHVKPLSKLMNINFNEYMKDPVKQVLKVAEHAGLSVGPDIEAKFKWFQENSPQEGSKVLKYDLESFGISEKEINDAFEPYEREYL